MNWFPQKTEEKYKATNDKKGIDYTSPFNTRKHLSNQAVKYTLKHTTVTHFQQSRGQGEPTGKIPEHWQQCKECPDLAPTFLH